MCQTRRVYGSNRDRYRLRSAPRSLLRETGPREGLFFEPLETKAAVVTCGGVCPVSTTLLALQCSSFTITMACRKCRAFATGPRVSTRKSLSYLRFLPEPRFALEKWCYPRGATISINRERSIYWAFAALSAFSLRRVKPFASWVATCALLFSPCVPVHGELRKGNVGFSNYGLPLCVQIVNRIKAKVSARLGEAENTQDRYFIIPFAYQDKRNKPEFSHSFISVIRVLADGKQPSLRSGFKRGRFKNRDFEAFTISWLPPDFDTNPHLCVFDGSAAALIRKGTNVLSPSGETSGLMRR